MGEVLWTPHWVIQPKFALPRAYIKTLAIGWLAGVTVVQPGNPLILEEHTFGGYRKYLKFKDNWWNYNSNVYTADWIIEDYYVIQPGTGLHVSNGLVDIDCHVDSAHHSPIFILSDSGGGHFYFFDFPAAPSDPWFGPLV